jgi:hypothetical protein
MKNFDFDNYFHKLSKNAQYLVCELKRGKTRYRAKQ